MSTDRVQIRFDTPLLASDATDTDFQPIFLPAIMNITAGPLRSIAVADVSGDGWPDMIVAGNGLLVRLGNGDGSFQSNNFYFYHGYSPTSVVVADENRDGTPDLLLAGGTLVNVLRGNGDGTFNDMGIQTSGVTSASSIAVADVNKDGKLDVVVADWEWESKLGVLLGNGDGTFSAPIVYTSLGGKWVTAADVNLDGKPDLVVANWSSSLDDDPNGLVGVLFGNGDGTFRPAITFSSGGYGALSVSTADVNKDGKPDIEVLSLCHTGPDCGNGAVGVLLGNGDGTFQPAVDYFPGGYNSHALAVGDVDQDHIPDLLITSCGPRSGSCPDDRNGLISVLLGKGDGTFQAATTYDSGGYGTTELALADVNGDNRPDLLVGSSMVFYPGGWTEGVGVLLNNAGSPPTTTTLVPDVNPAARRETVTYTASVEARFGGAVSGMVMFRDENRTIATIGLVSNQAAYSTRYRDPGTHPISATYSGDLQNGGSTSQTLTEYVQSGSRTSVVTSGSPSYVGQPVTFTATVIGTYSGAPVTDGDLVSFYDATSLLGSVALQGGVATFTTSSLSVKNHLIKADYLGNSLFKPSHKTVGQLVEKYPTTTTLTSAPNPSVLGDAVAFTATVIPNGPYPPTGRVKFMDGTTWIGSAVLSGGVATFKRSTLAVGTHNITAQYLGDAVFSKSTSSGLNQVVQ